jgi:hypothetical protein
VNDENEKHKRVWCIGGFSGRISFVWILQKKNNFRD